MLIRPKTKKTFEAVTFDEFVDYGRKTGATLHGESQMPWSFWYKGVQVTHETDTQYIVAGESFCKGQVLVSDLGDEDTNPVAFSQAEFEETYEIVAPAAA